MNEIHEIEDTAVNNNAAGEDISIVMNVFNHEKTVAEAIESALMQEMPFTSVIYCLNDASNDKSSEILNAYSERYPGKIKIYTSDKNQGSGKMNMYHNKPPVRGRYWCLLAGDDYWISKIKLAKQIEFLDVNSDFVGCSCHTVMRNEIDGTERIIRPKLNSWNLLDLLLKKYPFYVHPSSIIWRNIYIDQGFFLPPAFKSRNLFGDVILTHLMLSTGGKMQNIEEEMSCYRVTGRGIWTGKSIEERKVLQKKVDEGIKRSLTLKYRILCSVHRLLSRVDASCRVIESSSSHNRLLNTGLRRLVRFSRSCIDALRKSIPGPVNE